MCVPLAKSATNVQWSMSATPHYPHWVGTPMSHPPQSPNLGPFRLAPAKLLVQVRVGPGGLHGFTLGQGKKPYTKKASRGQHSLVGYSVCPVGCAMFFRGETGFLGEMQICTVSIRSQDLLMPEASWGKEQLGWEEEVPKRPQRGPQEGHKDGKKRSQRG